MLSRSVRSGSWRRHKNSHQGYLISTILSGYVSELCFFKMILYPVVGFALRRNKYKRMRMHSINFLAVWVWKYGYIESALPKSIKDAGVNFN